ncbi:MAG TPA: hypothetical protein PKD26_14540 [Pyrinomonadaceae bacterium]|nr:hypothetical protein [Pyrinomonadaceae bacterium]
MKRSYYPLFRLWPAVIIMALFAIPTDAQRRDYLTEHEIEIVRDTQDIDERITMLTRMIDRRFHVLGINVNGWKDVGKPSETWGDLPKGSRLELLGDIKKIIQKAVDDIDNLASNPSAAPIREKGDKRAKKDPDRLGIALRELAAAAARYITPLKSELDRAADEVERGVIIGSLELCDEIIEAEGRSRAVSK